MDRIAANVVYAGATAKAWYVLPGVPWSFRSETARDNDILDGARRFAGLTGRSLEIRKTARPWSAEKWREATAGTAINPLPGWADHLDREAAHLARLSLNDKLVMVGVSLERPLFGLARYLGAKRDDQAVAEQLDEVGRYMAGPGMHARPATQGEVEWLTRRSVALGCPTPAGRPELDGPWEQADLAELAGTADWTVEPFARTVKVVADIGWPETRPVTRYVSVLTVGRMPDVWDANPPWLSLCDKLGFPVEMSVRVNVLSEKTVLRDVQKALDRVKHQVAHHEEHDSTPKRSLARAADQALLIQDEVERGMNDLSTKTDIWVRFAVSGATETEVKDRCRRVVELYARHQITVAHTTDQYNLAREFIPAEPLSTVAYRRALPVTAVAGGVIQASHEVGHETGIYLGYTAQGAARRPVLWELHRSTEIREQSGLTLVGGTLGAGKSALLFMVAYKAAMAGVRTVILDPSGPLARLCDLPEFRANARHIDLLSARPGTLSPYRVIPEPLLEHFESHEEWHHAITMAHAARVDLCIDILQSFLPASVADDPETFIALSNAAGRVGGFQQMSARTVVDELVGTVGTSRLAEHSRNVGQILDRVSKLPAAQLVMPSGSSLDADEHGDDALVTVITMKGLALPKEGQPRREWTSEERMSTALLHLAAWLTQRSVYQRDMNERKLVIVDEVNVLVLVTSGRLFLQKSARDSRKHNVRSIYSSQGITDILGADVGNLVDTVFVGRTDDTAAQQAALKVLGVPSGVGFEEVLAGLSSHERGATGRSGTREFVFSDSEGGCEVVVVDLTSLPEHVQRALDTTANPHTVDKPGRVRVA
jgi:hypothetical protein